MLLCAHHASSCRQQLPRTSLCFTLLLLIWPIWCCAVPGIPAPLQYILEQTNVNLSALTFAEFGSFYLTEEAIGLKDYAIAVVKGESAQNGTVVVPASVWYNAAAGSTLIVGVSAVFLLDNSSLVDNGVPRLGVDIPLSTAQALSNLPGMLIGGGYQAAGMPGPRLNPRRGLVQTQSSTNPGILARLLGGGTARRSLLQLNASSVEDFWQSWYELLPAQLQSDVVAWLVTNNVTVTALQAPANAGTATVVQVFDFEVGVRGLTVENQESQAIRAVRTNRVGTDGSYAAGYIFQPSFTGFISTTLQSAAAIGFALASLNVSAIAAALGSYFGQQLQLLPSTITVEFDVLLRAQSSFNGGDIAAVLR
jgi:hypothetical protein